MKRREFIVGMASGVLGSPLPALAQRSLIPFIGYLSIGSPNEREVAVDAFREGLKQGGFIDGVDVAIEYRWAEGHDERLPRLAADLVSRKVAVIATSGGPQAALAAKAATRTIPIVFVATADPMRLGLVSSLSRPDANVTGVTTNLGSVDAKRIQIIRELLPTASTVAYLINPTAPSAYLKQELKEVDAVAKATGTKVHVVNASTAKEIEAAFRTIKKYRANALVVATEGLFTTSRELLIELAERYSIPACYSRREFTVDGGLMSYGVDYQSVYRQQGVYTARILKGATPGELPVVQAATYELILNLTTAKKLGLAIPQTLLVRADRVIQ